MKSRAKITKVEEADGNKALLGHNEKKEPKIKAKIEKSRKLKKQY